MEVSIISQGTVSGTPPGFFRFSHLVLCLLFLCVYVDTSVIFVKKSSEWFEHSKSVCTSQFV